MPRVMIPVLHKGDLCGYKLDQPAKTRHKHLLEAVERYGLTETKQRVNALYVFNIHHPVKAAKIERDKKYLLTL